MWKLGTVLLNPDSVPHAVYLLFQLTPSVHAVIAMNRVQPLQLTAVAANRLYNKLLSLLPATCPATFSLQPIQCSRTKPRAVGHPTPTSTSVEETKVLDHLKPKRDPKLASGAVRLGFSTVWVILADDHRSARTFPP
ncbi:hypothetical protein N656DRAFT_637362 [Canariomyces notabilis]|uniref:Uncharacterized protein n=1 Tax=Canariomyces notabilis TaxID=2074819 RepID=A0AAN6TEM0_9PEZI|nr:hypothetical protein N656DRAFT_637362 [Canariomyces arenarius]